MARICAGDVLNEYQANLIIHSNTIENNFVVVFFLTTAIEG